jgi:flagellar hook assembly protein FlgD
LENISTLIVTPNPFKEETVIRYKITGDLPLSVKIYDATGRLVKRFEILDRPLSDQITWDGCDDTKRHLPNGIYFLELKSANKTFTTHIPYNSTQIVFLMRG